MRLEYLPQGSQDCPLIRIYGGDLSTVAHLLKAFSRLACGETRECAIHDLPGIESVSGCQVFARVGKKDKGIILLKGPSTFDWVLKRETWLQVEGLAEPFTQPATARLHQWLDESSEISMLITNAENGAW